jgi:transposase
MRRRIKGLTYSKPLKTTFFLAALNQIHWNPKAKAYFEKKVSEGKTKKEALVFVMNRIGCIAYGVMKSGEPYRG